MLDITGNRRAADALAPMLDWSERIVSLLWPDDVIIPRLRAGIEGALAALCSGEKKKAEAQVYVTLTDMRDELLSQVMVSDPVRDMDIYQPAMEAPSRQG